MRRTTIAVLSLGLSMPAAAQILNPVTNPATSSPSTSIAVPRVGENVDEATAATERSAQEDAGTPGPTTQRDRQAAAAAHRRDKDAARDVDERPRTPPRD